MTFNYRFGQTTLGSNADSDADPNTDTNPETTPTSNTNINPNLWSGECNTCMVMKYDDDVFCEKCVGIILWNMVKYSTYLEDLVDRSRFD